MMSRQQQALPKLGETLAGRYQIVALRGEGMMGVVLEAHDFASGARVALKVLRPEVAHVPGVAERLDREGRVVATMRSPHVVRVFDLGTTPSGLPFFAMELLSGHDLAALMTAGRTFSIPEAVRWVRQACAGLAEAHALGVVHRDLKPHNLFLARQPDGSERLVILDFGVSKLLGDDASLTMTQASLGTPLYMAPEQVRSAKNVDARTDVWALGIVLFELITGDPPFDGESAHSVTAAIVADPPRQLRSLSAHAPPELEAVLNRALAKDPTQRFASVEALSAALAPFEAGQAVPDEQPTQVTHLPFDLDAPPPSAFGRAATQLAPGGGPSSAAAGWPAPTPTTTPAARARSRGTHLALAGGGLALLIGVTLLIRAGLAHRERLAAQASASASSRAEEPSAPTVARVLKHAREVQGATPFEPCILREGREPFAALSAKEVILEPKADLDVLFEKSKPPVFALDLPGGRPPPGATLLSVLTPLSPAHKGDGVPLLVVTDQKLYVGILRESLFEDISSSEKSEATRNGVVRDARAWVVAVEGDAPIPKLRVALNLLTASPGSISLAIPVDKAAELSFDGSYGCEAGAAKGARWISDPEWNDVGPATRVAEEACGREAPWYSGREARLLTFPGSRDACIESDSALPGPVRACIADAGKKLALALPKGKKTEPVRFDFMLRGPSIKPLCGR